MKLECQDLRGFLLLVIVIFMSVTDQVVNGVTKLSAATRYTIYEGDLPVKYSISGRMTNEEQLQLIQIETGVIVASTPLPSNASEAELTFDCGVIDKPGQYTFRMIDRPNGTVTSVTEVVTVDWPPVTLRLPQLTTILTDDVTMTSSIDDVTRCEPMDYGYDVQLIRLTGNHSNEAYTIVTTKQLKSISTLGTEVIVFPCSIIDQYGVYKAILKTRKSRDFVATSNIMVVRSDDAFTLSLTADVIFPCHHHVTVRYERPKCSGHEDRIRLLRLVRRNESVGMHGKEGGLGEEIALHKLELAHVTERKAVSTGKMVTFACSWFSAAEVGYCFRYSYVTRSELTVNSTISCLATTNSSADRVLVEWNSWSEWSSCTGDCRSSSPTRQRLRSCPQPYPGIRNCIGPALETSPCQLRCPEDAAEWKPVPGCECGCTMDQRKGLIQTSTGCKPPIIWLISAPKGHGVRLEFTIFELDANNPNTWVVVREGEPGLTFRLLVKTGGGMAPGTITTAQNLLSIEFSGSADSTRWNETAGQGKTDRFVANYTIFAADELNGYGTKSIPNRQAALELALTVSGITLFIVAAVVGVVFFAFRRRRSKKLTRTQSAHEPRAHEALLGKRSLTAEQSDNSSIVRSVVASYPETKEGQDTNKKRLRTEKSFCASPRHSHYDTISTMCSSRNSDNFDYETLVPATTAGKSSRRPLSGNQAQNESTLSDKPSKKDRSADASSSSLHTDLRKARKSKQLTSENDDLSLGLDEERPPVEGQDNSAPNTSQENISPPDLSNNPIHSHKGGAQQGTGIPKQKFQLFAKDTSPSEDFQHDESLMTPQSDKSSLIIPNQDSDFITNDEFEYDDFIPDLPGSYFAMDTPGYTLTWSNTK